jgi:hypothetical protein
MTNIRDFEPGAQEQRGAITASRYSASAESAPAFNYDHDAHWRFGIGMAATDASPADEVWIRLHGNAVAAYGEDDAILSVVAAELLQMALSEDPAATLSDGRKVAGLKPEDLWT